eukprot:11176373-Lingulodinium_polyedra.AAC.1
MRLAPTGANRTLAARARPLLPRQTAPRPTQSLPGRRQARASRRSSVAGPPDRHRAGARLGSGLPGPATPRAPR